MFVIALCIYILLSICTLISSCIHHNSHPRPRRNILYLNEPLQVRMIRNENLRNLNIPGDEPLEI